jgi:chromate transporter
MPSTPPAGRDVVPLGEATKVWFDISLQTFGGPAGQIAVMQHKLVDEKRWIGQQRFMHALNYCMLLPGPEAQQLAIYTGWLLNGTRGGLIAGSLFVLPGMLALLALSAIYVRFGETSAVSALFAGLAPAVIAIVVQAVQRVGKRALGHRALTGLAVGSFLALTFFAVPFPLVILAAGVLGWGLSRRIPSLRAAKPHSSSDGPAPLISDEALHHDLPSRRRSLTIVAVGLVLWFAPVAAAALLVTSTGVLVDEGLFFSGAAVVTFGGAYAVLAYVAQQAVNVYGWLAPGEMVRGLALAETTPGPLIMVVLFVAFVGAYRASCSCCWGLPTSSGCAATRTSPPP